MTEDLCIKARYKVHSARFQSKLYSFANVIFTETTAYLCCELFTMQASTLKQQIFYYISTVTHFQFNKNIIIEKLYMFYHIIVL